MPTTEWLVALGVLYVTFQTKHLLCDWIFQTTWMVQGKCRAERWAWPLLCHSGVHAAGTLAICMAWAPAFWWLAPVDWAVHFAIDRIKAAPSIGGRWAFGSKGFWNGIGADQMAHHLTHFGFVMLIMTRGWGG